jgi:hypothetical protein
LLLKSNVEGNRVYEVGIVGSNLGVLEVSSATPCGENECVAAAGTAADVTTWSGSLTLTLTNNGDASLTIGGVAAEAGTLAVNRVPVRPAPLLDELRQLYAQHEVGEGKTVVAQVLPGNPVAVLTGPTFAREVAEGKPAALTLACADADLAARIDPRRSMRWAHQPTKIIALVASELKPTSVRRVASALENICRHIAPPSSSCSTRATNAAMMSGENMAYPALAATISRQRPASTSSWVVTP